MLNSLLYATSFTIFRGEMGGGGRTVERFWRFREIKRTLNGKEKICKTVVGYDISYKVIQMLHQSQRKKEVDCLNVLMTFKLCQTLQRLEPGILRSVLLPNCGLTINFSLRSWWFFRASAQLSRASLRYPSPTKPGSIKVSGKLPTYPSPKPSFCPKWEASINVTLGEG